jgi:ABC-type ATPase involved in cell division
VTVVIASHDLEMIRKLKKPIVTLKSGKLLTSAPDLTEE